LLGEWGLVERVEEETGGEIKTTTAKGAEIKRNKSARGEGTRVREVGAIRDHPGRIQRSFPDYEKMHPPFSVSYARLDAEAFPACAVLRLLPVEPIERRDEERKTRSDENYPETLTFFRGPCVSPRASTHPPPAAIWLPFDTPTRPCIAFFFIKQRGKNCRSFMSNRPVSLYILSCFTLEIS
jgi:hypothetical protein